MDLIESNCDAQITRGKCAKQGLQDRFSTVARAVGLQMPRVQCCQSSAQVGDAAASTALRACASGSHIMYCLPAHSSSAWPTGPLHCSRILRNSEAVKARFPMQSCSRCATVFTSSLAEPRTLPSVCKGSHYGRGRMARTERCVRTGPTPLSTDKKCSKVSALIPLYSLFGTQRATFPVTVE